MQATEVPGFSHWSVSQLKSLIHYYTLSSGAEVMPKKLSTFAGIGNLQ